MRECPFPGCGRPISPTFFACSRHWRMLNAAEQRQIYNCYGQYQRDEIDIDQLRTEQQQVIDAVTARRPT